MVVSIYVPANGTIVENEQCGWSNVSVPLYNSDGIRITALFSPGQGIGMYALYVKVDQGNSVTFISDEIEITSSELSSVISLPVKIGHQGNYYSIGTIIGPANEKLHPRPESKVKPDLISIRLPKLRINELTIQPEAVELKLRKTPKLVGLCQ